MCHTMCWTQWALQSCVVSWWTVGNAIDRHYLFVSVSLRQKATALNAQGPLGVVVFYNVLFCRSMLYWSLVEAAQKLVEENPAILFAAVLVSDLWGFIVTIESTTRLSFVWARCSNLHCVYCLPSTFVGQGPYRSTVCTLSGAYRRLLRCQLLEHSTR